MGVEKKIASSVKTHEVRILGKEQINKEELRKNQPCLMQQGNP